MYVCMHARTQYQLPILFRDDRTIMHTEMERLSFLAVSYVVFYDYYIPLEHWYSDLTSLHIHDL